MDTTINRDLPQWDTTTGRTWQSRSLLFIVVAVTVIVLVGLTAWLLLRSDTPGEDSAEAGFARDMSMHHAQAIEMVLIAQERTDDPEIRILATDIILTQQGQIGQMRGWLDAWNLPPNSADLPMTWMGHPVDGRMPGMASPVEVAQLRDLPVPEMEELFLQLMIVHHQAGVDMAEAILDRTDNSTVRNLAQAIVTSQRYEIDAIQDLLERKGFDRVPDEPAMPEMESN